MGNPPLIIGATLSGLAALLHIGCIVFGASWYRFFGAGARMAQLAAAGSWRPALITTGIVLVLLVWSLYALSGAGVIPKLPFLRLGLCVITGIYFLRGIAGFWLAATAPGRYGVAFWCWSSAICLAIGMVYFVGTWQVWTKLGRAAA